MDLRTKLQLLYIVMRLTFVDVLLFYLAFSVGSFQKKGKGKKYGHSRRHAT